MQCFGPVQDRHSHHPIIRGVWRYQRGLRNLLFENRQITQWSKGKMTKGPTTLCKTPHRKPRKDFILNIFPKQNDNAYPSSIQIYLVTHSLQFIRIKWLFVLCLSDEYSRRVYYNSVSIMINQSIMINNHLF
jgi:hypothetical protein